jgi:hypothetical protein
MQGRQMRGKAAALLILLATPVSACAQAVGMRATASQPAFSQLPLKRDSSSETSTVESLAWATLLLGALTAAGFIAVRRTAWAGKVEGPNWLRPAIKVGSPKPLARTPLTQHASLHVIEWHSEELLIGCTAQSISLLARRASSSVADDAVCESKA